MSLLQAIEFIFITPLAGIIGALGMSSFMYVVSKKLLNTPVNMVEAVGSLVTGSAGNAKPMGIIIHLASGICFSFTYAGLFMAMNTDGFPFTFFAGIGLGFFHGMIVAYGLMYYMAERHPLPKYKYATFQVGLLHLIGHMLYGAIVGLIISFVPELTTRV